MIINILMTASICTHGMKGAFFSDKEREQMYLDTILYYCNQFKNEENRPNIIFVDNSDWDLNYIQSQIEYSNIEYSNIEYISLKAAEFDISKGKGYNEFLLIDKAIEESKYLKQCNGFFKVTGRYPIINIKKFIQNIKNTNLIYCDFKDHKIYDRLGLNWSGHSCETRIFYINREFYKTHLYNRYKKCNDYTGYLAENLMYDFVKKLDNRNGDIKIRFHREAVLGGVEGSPATSIMCSNNHNSFKCKAKIFIGNCFRIFLPWLYI